MSADETAAVGVARPLFSVVIPSRNRAGMLQRCLESVVAQDFASYEIVVVDGGSTDGTAAVLERFSARVHAIQQRNNGPSEARNLGVAAASGRFVVFVDSDDVLAPSALQLYASLVGGPGGPTMVLAAFQPFSEERELAQLGRHDGPPTIQAFATYLEAASEGHLSGTHRLIIERSVYVAAAGLSTNFRVCEDQDFGLRINQTGPCLVILSPATVGYRLHAGNISKDAADFARGIRQIVSGEKSGAYPGTPATVTRRRSVITRTARSASAGCVSAGRYLQALAIYRDTLAWHLVERRMRYVLGLPLLVVVAAVNRRAANALLRTL